MQIFNLQLNLLNFKNFSGESLFWISTLHQPSKMLKTPPRFFPLTDFFFLVGEPLVLPLVLSSLRFAVVVEAISFVNLARSLVHLVCLYSSYQCVCTDAISLIRFKLMKTITKWTLYIYIGIRHYLLSLVRIIHRHI